MRLVDLEAGEEGEITALEGGRGFRDKVTNMGLRVGKNIRMAAKQPAGGPVVVEVENITVTLGRGMAMKILVEEE